MPPWLLLSIAAGAGPLEDAAAQGVQLGGPTGHCPAIGKPSTEGLGEYGVRWIPVGFSEAGALASLSFEDSDMGPHWVAEVRSLASDTSVGRVVWAVGFGRASPPPVSAFLEQKGTEITALLTKHGVAITPITELHPPTFEAEGRTFTVAQPSIAPDPDRHLVGDWYATTLTNDEGASKRAATSGNILRHTLLGVLKSPHEPRVAILTAITVRGFEGVGECRIEVIGAHLIERFPATTP